MLFAWLLARRFNGKFLFRLEDTDRTRLVPESVKSMVEDFAWLGFDIDEGPTADDLKKAGYDWEGAKGFPGGPYPYIQSLRVDRYREVAEDLIRGGFAYRCDCTPERLEAQRQEQLASGGTTGYSGYCRSRNVPANVPHVVRFLIPEGQSVTFEDAIRGRIVWDSVILKDMVILKTDGFPTYHLASTVDDHDMRISHVMRGEEWISTTPLHVLMYRALEWEAPVIAHLPAILGSDGKKLSKRHGAAFCKTFREEGYLPDALLNFLLLNGWSPGEGCEQEVFTRREMIANFSLDRVKAAGAVFSFDKLKWMNAVYIRNTPDPELAELVKPFLIESGLKVDDGRLRQIIPHVRERMNASLKDALPFVEFLFVDQVNVSVTDILHQKVTLEQAIRVLSAAADTLRTSPSFDPTAVEEKLRDLPKAFGLPPKAVFMTIRVAVTGRKATPPLFESISILGRERTVERLQAAIASLDGGQT
jgi:glutamyl-tRNA synthetase